LLCVFRNVLQGPPCDGLEPFVAREQDVGLPRGSSRFQAWVRLGTLGRRHWSSA
jgi:hypothetical protein